MGGHPAGPARGQHSAVRQGFQPPDLDIPRGRAPAHPHHHEPRPELQPGDPPSHRHILPQTGSGGEERGHEAWTRDHRIHLYEIALVKSQDPPLQMVDLQDVCRQLVDSANSLGIKVVDELDPDWYQKFLEERKEIVKTQKEEIQKAKEAKLLRTA